MQDRSSQIAASAARQPGSYEVGVIWCNDVVGRCDGFDSAANLINGIFPHFDRLVVLEAAGKPPGASSGFLPRSENWGLLVGMGFHCVLCSFPGTTGELDQPD